jgi:thiamine pyrophosphate-dependent acetolactate synthase large subunit-like protein
LAAVAELRRLAELTGARLATTLPARNLFAGHPLDVAVAGTFSTAAGFELLAQSDLVLAFGASLNSFTTLDRTLFKRASVVQIDSDARSIGRFLKPEVGVVADARATARALVRELESRGGARSKRIPVDVTEAPQLHLAPGSPGRLDVRAVMSELDRILPLPRALVFDGGNQALTSISYLRQNDPGAFAWTNEYYAIGCGLGVAMGAAVARSDGITILVTGDGALMMSLADLDTAARLKLRLIIVVADDGALGTEVQYLRDRGLATTVATYRNPDLAQLATAAGFQAVTVTRMEDLRRIEDSVARSAPLFIRCMVGGDVITEFASNQRQ